MLMVVLILGAWGLNSMQKRRFRRGLPARSIRHPMAITYHTRRRVEFVDTDMAGILHFSTYYRWMESVEHEFFRSHDEAVHGQGEGGMFGYARVSAEASFSAPMRYPEEVEAELTVEELKRSSVTYSFVFRRAVGGEEVARGRMTTVHVGCGEGETSMRAIAIPDRVRRFLGAGA